MTDQNTDFIAVATDPHVLEGEYAVFRRTEYPSIANQLDMLFKDINAGYFGENAKNSQWYKAIEEIKSKYPKAE